MKNKIELTQMNTLVFGATVTIPRQQVYLVLIVKGVRKNVQNGWQMREQGPVHTVTSMTSCFICTVDSVFEKLITGWDRLWNILWFGSSGYRYIWKKRFLDFRYRPIEYVYMGNLFLSYLTMLILLHVLCGLRWNREIIMNDDLTRRWA
jgi:hypothetical protein